MSSWRFFAILLAFLATVTSILAEEIYLTSDDYYATTCSGVWSQQSIPGGSQPYIKVTMGSQSYGKASMLIYEWRDYDNIGHSNNDTNEVDYICDNKAVSQKLCSPQDLGHFITRVPADQLNSTSILTTSFDLNNTTERALYKVESTGYYCVAIVPTPNGSGNGSYFEAWVEWKFPYGELPAVDYPKLLLYGVFALVYLSVGIFWLVQSFRYWSDILPVQHFLSGAIFFLTVEMAFNWGFWEAYNQTGKPSWFLLALVALLNAGRTSISFFMLLIVCMGYSVVRPSLGSAMKKCIILACTHFFFGVVYSLGTMLLSPEKAGLLVLLVIFPLSITMTAFYIWTLNSITTTMADLERRKQHVKILMYKRLYRLLLFSVVMVLLIFILNMLNFSDRMAIDWAARNWKWRWFMLDGMLNILYFVVFIVIVILWRPTSNNARYGLEQISQDEEEALALERLQNQEGTGQGGLKSRDSSQGRNMDDDDAVLFELGDEPSDDEQGPSNNAGQHREQRAQTSRRQHSKEEESALLHVSQDDDDEEEDHLDDSERARLTEHAQQPRR